MRCRTVFALPALLLMGCSEAPSPTAPVAVRPPLFSSAPTVTTAPFFAVAQCASDIGYDIRFGGERALATHTTIDAAGKSHTIMQFQVQDFMGWRLPETTFTPGTVDFDAQGGAEMFAIQRDDQGNITVRIHQGNLVFESLSEDLRVIAHHTIREVPGQGPVSFWRCRSVG